MIRDRIEADGELNGEKLGSGDTLRWIEQMIR